MQPNSTIWEFPKTHAIKIIGLQADPIKDIALKIVEDLALNHERKSIESKLSSNGKYISITIHIHFTHMSQVEQIYGAFHAHPKIVQSL